MKIKKILHLIWELGYILIAFIVIYSYRTIVREGYGLPLRRALIIGFIWLIISISVYKLANWIAQRKKPSLKVVKAIGWLNLVSWIIGSFGLIVSSSTIAFAQLLPDNQRKFFKGLAYTNLLLSVSNAVASISHFDLYYVGLVGFGAGFLYIMIAIAVYLFFVGTNKKEIKIQDKSAENVSSENPNNAKYLGKHIPLLVGGLLLITVGFGPFYWFEIRPAKIRSECSWIKRHSDAVPEKPAMTEQELSNKGMLNDCGKYISNNPRYYGVFEKYNDEFEERKLELLCQNDEIINEYKTARPAQPARDWFEKATKKEYEFCLHDRGL